MSFPEIDLVNVGLIAAGLLVLLGSVWILKRALGLFEDKETYMRE